MNQKENEPIEDHLVSEERLGNDPMNQKPCCEERNVCAFCRADTGVLRQYFHAKNKPMVGDGFTFIYYCAECGLDETITSHSSKPESVNYASTDTRPRVFAVKVNGKVIETHEHLNVLTEKYGPDEKYTYTKVPVEPESEEWSESKANLLALATKHPMMMGDCLDSAYLAGLDASKSNTNSPDSISSSEEANQNEWADFDERFYFVGTDERDFDGQVIRDEIKAYITANFVSKKRIKEVIDQELESGVPPSGDYLLKRIKQELLGND